MPNLDKLQSCFESEGMTLIPEDGSVAGPGVRFGSYPGRVIKRDVPAERPMAAE